MNEYTIDSILKREFPTIDGKRSWGITNEIWKHCVKYGKDLEALARKECEDKAEKARKEAEDAAVKKKDGKKSILTPEERMEAIADLLDTKLLSKELSAAEIRELKDLFNLKAADQDILIEMVDYRSVQMTEAEIIESVKRLIDRANEKDK